MTTKRRDRTQRRGDERKALIARAALAVIERHGVSGLTHRRVATEAGVSLGTTTYHFATLDDILESAFGVAMSEDMDGLTQWFESLPAGCDLPEELTQLVLRKTSQEKGNVYVNFELVLAAAQRPSLHVKAHAWATFLARLFERYVSDEAAEAVAVVYDGTLLRQTITGSIGGADEIATSFRRACGEEDRLTVQATSGR
ncbi:TetR family transcriptional regulator [Streptomyces sp. NPDC051322]|uniref:TetR/AcrR family transcriptional regulator n=1 Tax=Streptomyces sp. NPDC051322 TaxID=3154645 RepID=UPI00344B990B